VDNTNIGSKTKGQRIAQQDSKLVNHSKETQALLPWIRAHKEKHTATRKGKYTEENMENPENPTPDDAMDDEYLHEAAAEVSPCTEGGAKKQCTTTTLSTKNI
jgi:hypothetical protein